MYLKKIYKGKLEELMELGSWCTFEGRTWAAPIGGNVFCDSFERNISPPAIVGGLMDKTIRPDARNRVKPRHRSIRVESDCN